MGSTDGDAATSEVEGALVTGGESATGANDDGAMVAISTAIGCIVSSGFGIEGALATGDFDASGDTGAISSGFGIDGAAVVAGSAVITGVGAEVVALITGDISSGLLPMITGALVAGANVIGAPVASADETEDGATTVESLTGARVSGSSMTGPLEGANVGKVDSKVGVSEGLKDGTSEGKTGVSP